MRSVQAPSWLPLAVLAGLVAAAMVLPLVAPLLASIAAVQKALIAARVDGGGLAGWVLAAPHVAAWAGAVILGPPLFLLGLVVAAERWLGAPVRPRREPALAWAMQATFLVAAYAIGLLLERFVRPLSPLPAFDWTGLGPLAGAALPGLYFLAIMLLTDLMQYWAHRAHHRFTFLWKFHAVHHAQRGLDVVHNINHPAELAARWLIAALPIGLLPAADGSSLAALVAFYQIHNHLLHMNGPIHFGRFNLLVADNRYHFVHHSRDPRHFDSNFAAIFPVIGMMFGTWRRPERAALPETGLDGQLAPSTLAGYLLARLSDEARIAPRS